MTALHVGNLRVFVLYPSSDGMEFDSEYWLTTHYDLLKNGVWKEALEIEFSLGTPDSPYVAVATVVFADKERLNASLADPGMAEVVADISQYTNIQPVVFNSEISRDL